MYKLSTRRLVRSSVLRLKQFMSLSHHLISGRVKRICGLPILQGVSQKVFLFNQRELFTGIIIR